LIRRLFAVLAVENLSQRTGIFTLSLPFVSYLMASASPVVSGT